MKASTRGPRQEEDDVSRGGGIDGSVAAEEGLLLADHSIASRDGDCCDENEQGEEERDNDGCDGKGGVPNVAAAGEI